MRTLLALLGLVELISPKRLIEFGERLAFENPDEATLRPWILPVARLEGIGWMLVVLRGGRLRSTFETLLGPVGAAMILTPGRVVDGAIRLAYADADRISLRSWVVPVTRALGVVYVLTAIRALVGRGAHSEGTAG